MLFFIIGIFKYTIANQYLQNKIASSCPRHIICCSTYPKTIFHFIAGIWIPQKLNGNWILENKLGTNRKTVKSEKLQREIEWNLWDNLIFIKSPQTFSPFIPRFNKFRCTINIKIMINNLTFIWINFSYIFLYGHVFNNCNNKTYFISNIVIVNKFIFILQKKREVKKLKWKFIHLLPDDFIIGQGHVDAQ